MFNVSIPNLVRPFIRLWRGTIPINLLTSGKDTLRFPGNGGMKTDAARFQLSLASVFRIRYVLLKTTSWRGWTRENSIRSDTSLEMCVFWMAGNVGNDARVRGPMWITASKSMMGISRITHTKWPLEWAFCMSESKIPSRLLIFSSI